MAGSIFANINPSTTSGTDLATVLNDFKDIIRSGFKGSTRPTNLSAGGYWIDDTNPTLWLYKFFDGTSDITAFSINTATGAISIAGAEGVFTVSKTSADTVGAILDLVKKRVANNGQSLIGDDLGVINFKSTTDSGTQIISARVRAVALNNGTTSQAGAYLVFEEIDTNSNSLVERMRLIDGKLGVNVAAPAYDIHGKGTLGVAHENESDTTNPALFVARKKRVSGSGQVLANDVIRRDKADSTDNTGALVDSAFAVDVVATQNHTSTAQGTRADFKVKQTGQNTQTTIMQLGDEAAFPIGSRSRSLILGTTSAANNAKLHRSANAKVQVVAGNDSTAEGTEATILAQFSARVENFTDAGKPAAGNVGRIIYVTDTARFEFDNGTGWDQIGGGKLVVSSQLSLTSAAAIQFSGTTPRRLVKVSTASGEQDLSALSPQIQAGVEEGQELILVGQSDTNYIVIKNGNGLKINGDWISTGNSILKLVWVGSLWVETGRA